MSTQKSINGKYTCRLTHNKIRHMKYVHNLVYENYIGDIPVNNFVKFIDSDVNNCNYKNLGLTTKKDELKKRNNDVILDNNKEWKIIKKNYKISNYGDIYSLKSQKLLKSQKTKNGYYKITMFVDNLKQNISIHRLVYETFTKKLKKGLVIDHIDRNPSNNYIKNLRQVIQSVNISNIDIKPRLKHRIFQYDMKNNFIKKWKNIDKILENNESMKKRTILVACSNHRKSAYGFIWKSKNYINTSLNKFIKIGLIDNKEYSNYRINKEGGIINNNNRLLQPGTINGYKCIGITSDDGKQRTIKVHRLVAIRFINNENDKPVVNHIDKNRLNNKVSNLEWTSYSENNIHSCGIKVKRIDVKTNTTKIYNSISDASTDMNNGIKHKQTHISDVCKGKRKTAYGFKWSFVK
jgi:hypothetical protein